MALTDIASALPVATLNLPGTDPAAVTVGILDSSGNLISPAKDGTLTGGTMKTQIVDSGGNVVGETSNALDVNIKSQAASLATSTKQSDGSQKAQIVDGSGNVIASTSNALDVYISGQGVSLATSTIQTNGSQKAQIVDGSGNVIGATGNALDVNLKTSSITVNENLTEIAGTAVGVSNPLYTRLSDGTAALIGQKQMVGSLPVTMASDQGPIDVNVVSTVATAPVNDYFASASPVAPAAQDTHTYTSIAANNFLLMQVWASGSGRIKVDVQTKHSTNPAVTLFTAFNSTSDPNIMIPVPAAKVPTGDLVLVVITNEENAKSQTVYSTISGENV